MKNNKIQFFPINKKEEYTIPVKAHESDAGWDLTCTKITQELDEAGKVVLVYHTNIGIIPPDGYAAFLFPRSSVANTSLNLTNSVGVIDEGYRGEVMAKFKIMTDALPRVYKPGDRFAQLVFLKVDKLEAEEIEYSEEEHGSDRGAGGYGSSDENKETKEDKE